MQQNASDSSGSSSPVYLDVAARLAEVFLRLESDVLQRSFPQLRLRDLGAPTFWTYAGPHRDPLPPVSPSRQFFLALRWQGDPINPL